MATAESPPAASGDKSKQQQQQQHQQQQHSSDYRRSSVTSEMSILKLADQSGQRRILLPVDGSEHSERAFHWFLGNLRRDTDQTVLAFVVNPPQYTDGQSSSSSFVQEGNRAYNEGVKEAGRLKVKFLGFCKQAGVPESSVTFQELIGSKPGETIVRYIKEAEVACVVIGSRGLGKIKRTFLGSVSDHLLHNAGCPVIICPNRKEKKEKKEKDKRERKDDA